MNIKDLIQLSADLSVGLDRPSDLDEEVYLRYLNLVHFDLYKSTGVINPYLPIIKEDVKMTDGVGTLRDFPFIIRSVAHYEGNIYKPLKSTSYDIILSRDPQEKEAGQPLHWYFAGQKLHIYPKATKEIHVVYMPQANVLTAETLEEDMPYPPLYHPVLADGAAYYIMQGEGGMRGKDDVKLALAKYDKGKKNLYQYLLALSGSSIGSTFSQV